MMEPADFGPRHDPTGAVWVDDAGLGRVLAERQVRSRALVVRDVGVKDPSEMPLVEDDHVVQTLAADGPDDAFDVGILPGRAWCGADGCQAERFGGAVERCVEGRVTVVEQESRGGVVRESLAELLSGPHGRGMRRDVDMQDAAAVVGEDDEDEQDLAGERGNREEVESRRSSRDGS